MYCACSARARWGPNARSVSILQNVFLEGFQLSGPVQEAIGKFIAARQVTDHPIVVARWERKPAEDGD